MTDTDTQTPSVADVRDALIREAGDFGTRRRSYHNAIRTLPETDPLAQASFDAYEGLASAGCFAQTIAAILRVAAERHPETAADLASLVHEVMENGDDCLDGPNDDVWARVEQERAEAAAAKADPIAAAVESMRVIEQADRESAAVREAGTGAAR